MNLRATLHLLMTGCVFASTAASAAVFSVNDTTDATDANPGDGVCATATSVCTLRAAIMEANATAGPDVIDLTAINNPATPITLSIAGVDETFVPTPAGSAEPCMADITADASIGDLDITEDLEVVGAGPGLTVIRWDQQSITDPDIGDRIFHVQAPTGATINLVKFSDLMVTDGSVGILNDTDPANPYNCEVTGAPGSLEAWQFRRFGGAVAVGPGAAVVLFQETVHGPGTGGGGGSGGPPPGVGPGGDEGETEGSVVAVELERVAVIGNQSGSDAGGVISAAELSVIDSVFSGNSSGGNGGALYLDSTTSIAGSLIGSSSTDVPYASGPIAAATVANPNTAENGGGIFDTGAHTTTIERSAINGNSAIGGGGIAARALVTVNLTNTTVSGNIGTDVGGGITTNGTVNLRNVVIADNSAATDATGGGAGLNSFGSGTYTFFNTILANNEVAGSTVREANCGCSGGAATCAPGRMVSTGFNISDETTDSCDLDVTLSDMPATDPLLMPLANNGGLTETHALPSAAIGAVATSPAIDAADTVRCPNNDQRGSLRPDDGDLNGSYECDIGSFELFIARTDLHINNVTAPDQVDKGMPFDVVVELHNDDGNSIAPGVTLDATVDSATGMTIQSAVPSTGSCTVAASDTLNCTIGDMAVGSIETVTITLVGNQQGTFALLSTVDQTGNPALVDTVPGNNDVTVRVAILGNSDIAVSGGTSATTANINESITYDYTVVNNGEDDATNVHFGVTLPTDATFVSATASQGSCALSAGEILCPLGDMSTAAPVMVQVVLSGTASGDLTIEADTTADQNDPDATNNSVVTTVTIINNADLSIVAAPPSAGVSIRDAAFTMSVPVYNAGPQAALNVVLTTQLPAGYSMVSSNACTEAGGMVTCTIASIAANTTASLGMTLKATQTGTATLAFTVSSDINDPDPTNNTGSRSVSILAPPKKSKHGGCVYQPGGGFDPVLPALLLIAFAGLMWRRRRASVSQ